MEEKTYICEYCGFKSDRLKKCCGLKMIDIKNTIKIASNMCSCYGKFQ